MRRLSIGRKISPPIPTNTHPATVMMPSACARVSTLPLQNALRPSFVLNGSSAAPLTV
jgi:hypothetical protein